MVGVGLHRRRKAAGSGIALARDASTDAGLSNPVSSKTFAYTTTGTNRVLYVGCFGDTTDAITGATYAGAAMTLVGKDHVGGDRWVYLFVLANPALGANNVVISASASIAIDAMAVSYTVAKQTGQPDSSATGTGTPTITLPTTVVAPGCWLVGVFRASTTAGVAASGTNQLQASNGLYLADSNGVVGTGPQSLGYTNGGAFAGVVASIAHA